MGKVKHGIEKDLAYRCWTSMRQRCNNPNNSVYLRYGGRGIKVCEEWNQVNGVGFKQFLKDMGPRPSNSHSIERLDVNGDYCPENCIWIENEKQNRNQRKQVNNTSGVTGVAFHKNNNSWVASCLELNIGKRRHKSFSINKYGEEAYKMACEYRQKMIEELNEQGAGYGENHGK